MSEPIEHDGDGPGFVMRVLLEGAVCQGCGQEVAYTIVRGQVIKRGWLHPDGNLRCTDASRTNHRYQEPDQ